MIHIYIYIYIYIYYIYIYIYIMYVCVSILYWRYNGNKENYVNVHVYEHVVMYICELLYENLTYDAKIEF